MLKVFVKTFKFPQLLNAVFLERDAAAVNGFSRWGGSETDRRSVRWSLHGGRTCSTPTEGVAFFGLLHRADQGRPYE